MSVSRDTIRLDKKGGKCSRAERGGSRAERGGRGCRGYPG